MKHIRIVLLFTVSLLFSSTLVSQPFELDPTFGDNGEVIISDFNRFGVSSDLMLLQEDDKIILLRSRPLHVLRLDADGRLDETFGEAGYLANERIADIQTGILLCESGGFTYVSGKLSGGSPREGVVFRFNEKGQLDTDFGENGLCSLQENYGEAFFARNAFPYTDDGGIILQIHKQFLESNPPIPKYENLLIRLNEDGSLNSEIGTDGTANLDKSTRIPQVIQREDGGLLAVWAFPNRNQTTDLKIIRYDPLGKMDTTFGKNGVGNFTLDVVDAYFLQ